ncbi:MAG: flavin-containing monooxygenase [Ktedonobacterales bacterium]
MNRISADGDKHSDGAQGTCVMAAVPQGSGGETHTGVAILGTGFSGLGMAIRLKQQGYDDFVVLERADDVGGTWRDNTYPGCACDVPSHLYSFSFAPNPLWSRAYSPQSEIWKYLRRCAERFGILPHIRWNSELLDAIWDERDLCWHILTTQGRIAADMLIFGNGPLSEPSLPTIPGIEHFAGTLFHSARWDHEHDLSGERVAVIGTGASAIQFVPQIQPRVEQLTLFQRTPPWIMPRLDHAIPDWQKALYDGLPFTQRLVRSVIYTRAELVALGLVYRPQMMRDAEKIALKHLHRQVEDPELRTKLTPNYLMGCKRILLSDDFYPALTQANVDVVTDSIHEVHPHSIVTADGQERAVDTIICATGFHVTDMGISQRVRGRDGRTLGDAWNEGPRAYLGAAIAGFPNFFLLIGPNTGVGHTSMVYMIESQIAYVLDCLRSMRRNGLQAVEVRPETQRAYNDELQRRMSGTVWTSGCASWYLDAHGRNSTLWPGFTFEFRHRTRRFDVARYETMAMSAERVAAPAGQRATL